jgi:Mg-chelatase subunit ChlD
MTTAIVEGSVQAVAQASGQSIAESFVMCDVIVIVDTSGSMAQRDSRGEKSRYEVACEDLEAIQKSMPGRVAVISFSDEVEFCPGGIPVYKGGSTDLAKALRFAKMADVAGCRFILISDGEPDKPEEAMSVAKTYTARIDVVYVGPEANPIGRFYLEKLAKASSGTTVTSDRASDLLSTVTKLLGNGDSV